MAGAAGALGFAPIDALHAEFDEVVAELRLAGASGPAGLRRALHALREHLLRHFGAEERWMREADFPPLACHAREHASVLAVVEEVLRRHGQGDGEVAVRLAEELPRWFALHAATMDEALAQFLRARAHAADARP